MFYLWNRNKKNRRRNQTITEYEISAIVFDDKLGSSNCKFKD